MTDSLVTAMNQDFATLELDTRIAFLELRSEICDAFAVVAERLGVNADGALMTELGEIWMEAQHRIERATEHGPNPA